MVARGAGHEGVVGRRPGCQSMDISEGLRYLVQRTCEWGLPLFILSMDIQAAFDHMRPTVIAKLLRARGCTAHLCAAWLREHRQLYFVPAVAGVEAEPVRMHRGCRQGGQSTPGVWNEVSAECLAEVRSECERTPACKVALPWAAELEEWSIVVFADNWYLLGASVQLLQQRARIVEAVWAKLGHTFGTGSLEILPNEPAKLEQQRGEPLQCSLADGRVFTEVDKLVALGIAIDNRGSTEAAVTHRVAMATRLTAYRQPAIVAEIDARYAVPSVQLEQKFKQLKLRQYQQ